MTPTGRTGPTDRDAELEELLRLLTSERARLDDPRVQRAARRIYGRPDALELLREVAREERLVRLLQVRTGIEPLAAGDADRARERRAPSIASIGSVPRASARGRIWSSIGLAAAAALLVGVALGWSTISSLLKNARSGAPAPGITVATRAAELDTVNMPDGSRVILAPSSRLRYAMSPRTGPREIRLEGEALFEVKHDDRRPFRVRTRRAVVEDLGTSFVVREYAEDSRARVAVRSGAAALHASDDTSASPVALRPGDGAYVGSSGAIARFSGDPESYGSWASGRFEFDATPLPEVLAELSSWYDVEFRMGDSTLERQYFTGGFSSDSLSRALAILGPVVHARFRQEGRVVEVTSLPDGS